jgi:hypothetical protein
MARWLGLSAMSNSKGGKDFYIKPVLETTTLENPLYLDTTFENEESD